MKILTICNCPLVESQGSGYVIGNFVRGLRSLGHEVDLLGPLSFEPLSHLCIGKGHRQAVGMAIHSLVHILKGCSYDVVEFYGGEACLAVPLLRRWPRRNFLLVQHSNGIEPHCSEQMCKVIGSDTLNGLPRRWHQRLLPLPMERAFRDVDGLVTVSEFDRSYAESHGYQRADRIVAIENALEDGFFSEPVNFERPPVFGYCGSWIMNKGSRWLPKSLNRVLEDFPRVKLRLAGVGGDFKKSDHFSAGVCGRVEVMDFLHDKSELRQFYKSLSVFISASVYESFGLVGAEAMACGCALVSTCTGFAAGLKSGHEVQLCESPDEDSVYKALETLLLDDSLRLKIAAGGHARTQSLHWSTSVLRLESTYIGWLEALRSGGISGVR